ncbi:DNA polymerase [Paracoccaceae bacterium]|nr:DNA polymerase [Paracoccaceae bacterium]
MELNSLSRRISSQIGEVKSSGKFLDNETINQKESSYEVVLSTTQLDDWCKRISKQNFFSIDTETTSLDELSADIVGISLCLSPGRACYIPVAHKEQRNKDISEPDQLNLDLVLAKLKPILENKNVLKIGQNIKYDIKVLNKYGVSIVSFDDTMLMSNCINAGRQRHSLDTLAQNLLNHTKIQLKDLLGSGKNQLSFDEVPISLGANYAAEDADMTFRVWQILKKELITQSVYSVYQNIDKPMIRVLIDAELEGVKVNEAQLEKLSGYFKKKLAVLEDKVFSLSGMNFNIGSPKQLGEVLFERMELPDGKKNKTGGFQTGAEILENLSLKGFEIASLILEWRKISKLKSTYSDSLRSHINRSTGRVHTSYNLAGTSTGRLSSSDPNLQNIPIRDTEGKKIREAFISKPGYSLLSLDYNQIELRLLAHIANVNGLKNAFRENIDIHTSTASKIFKIPLQDITPNTRRRAKAINFGIIYGISAFGLARNLNISRTEAQDFINSDEATGKCIVLITPDKERTMNTFLGATELLTVSDVDEELIASVNGFISRATDLMAKKAKRLFIKLLH